MPESPNASETVLAMVTAMLDGDEATAFLLLSETVSPSPYATPQLLSATWALLAMVVTLVRDTAEKAGRDPLEMWSSLVLAERVRRGEGWPLP